MNVPTCASFWNRSHGVPVCCKPRGLEIFFWRYSVKLMPLTASTISSSIPKPSLQYAPKSPGSAFRRWVCISRSSVSCGTISRDSICMKSPLVVPMRPERWFISIRTVMSL